MKTEKIVLEDGKEIEVRGMKVKEAAKIGVDKTRLENTQSYKNGSDPSGLQEAVNELNFNAIEACLTKKPADLSVRELSLGDFKKIEAAVMRLSGGGEVEKKS
jgi:hypothetical protein